jgi:hypothetical protein
LACNLNDHRTLIQVRPLFRTSYYSNSILAPITLISVSQPSPITLPTSFSPLPRLATKALHSPFLPLPLSSSSFSLDRVPISLHGCSLQAWFELLQPRSPRIRREQAAGNISFLLPYGVHYLNWSMLLRAKSWSCSTACETVSNPWCQGALACVLTSRLSIVFRSIMDNRYATLVIRGFLTPALCPSIQTTDILLINVTLALICVAFCARKSSPAHLAVPGLGFPSPFRPWFVLPYKSLCNNARLINPQRCPRRRI